MNNAVQWFLIILGLLLIIWALLLWNGNVSPISSYNAQTTAKVAFVIGLILLLIGLFFWCSERGYFFASGNKEIVVTKVTSPGLSRATMKKVPELRPLSPQGSTMS